MESVPFEFQGGQTEANDTMAQCPGKLFLQGESFVFPMLTINAGQQDRGAGLSVAVTTLREMRVCRDACRLTGWLEDLKVVSFALHIVPCTYLLTRLLALVE